MSKPVLSLKSLLLGASLLLIPIFGYVFWHLSSSPATLATLTDSYQGAGTQVKQDFQTLPVLPLTETDQAYTIADTTSDGIDIQFANATEPTLSEGEDSLRGSTSKSPLTLSFPKDYSKPLEVKLDDTRTVTITDLSGKSDYTATTLSQDTGDQPFGSEASKSGEDQEEGFFQRLLSLGGFASQSESETPQNYLQYTSQDERKSLLYAYQKDQASGEKKLKHWTLYQKGDGIEQESYQFTNAKLRITPEGVAEVFYYGEQNLKNDQAAKEVDTNLLDRAQRFLAKEMGDDLLNRGLTPDFTIPKPYYIDKEGIKHEAEWRWNEESSTLSVSFTPESYPVALDPTLSFTAPGVSNSGSVITGEAAWGSFGQSLVAGDFNADGKMDLAVAGSMKIFIFYGGSLHTGNTSGADVILTNNEGEGWIHLAAGDFNVDGKTDLVVGDAYYPTFSSPLGRVYIFYGGSLVAKNFSAADVIISSEGAYQDHFGFAFAVGDFNADGRTDLAASDDTYNFSVGRVYIFYGGSIVTENASGADVKISGPSGIPYFGSALTAGDFNADGEMDLAVGAKGVAAQNGSTYIFYNDGSIPTTAATADVTITGEADGGYFGDSLASGDINSNGTIDLIVGAKYSSSNKGRAYVFYNDGSIPTTAATADVIITGETAFGAFGASLAVGDFNSDGKTDLIVGAGAYSSSTGRAYIFYNDSSLSATAATADVIITGQGMTNSFGVSLTIGDFNADGRTDLVVGASSYASSRGRAYIFYSQNGQVNTNQSITGETTNNSFGNALATGDLNADGRTDLIVGASYYDTGSSNVGRVYVFYNDGSYATGGASADAIMTGEAATDLFGWSLTSGDFNADGKTDLAVGARGYSSSAGRAYIFYNGSITTEGAGTADIILTGEASSLFGHALTAGDLNADGKTDFVVGATSYSSSAGRAYIFYNGSIITEAATGADIIITGTSSPDGFGYALVAGDFNADGRTDLVSSAPYRSSGGYDNGVVYFFYNDGSIPTTAATADASVSATSEYYLGLYLAVGDLNVDGRVDLIALTAFQGSYVSANIFYNDGSYGTADVIIDIGSGGTSSNPAVGDFNADGRIDIAVGLAPYSTNTGQTYIFYNDGSYPGDATGADVTITGETTSNYFGYVLTAGDMNADGRTDLIVGAYGNSTNTGKVYFYETRENFAWEIQEQFQPTTSAARTGVNGTGQEIQITGEASSGFGSQMATGDWNADGRIDLAVSATSYASSTGRAYIFYSDGSIAPAAASADVVIVGESGSFFGYPIASGDWNADGRTDLAVGATGYSTDTGRAYIFYNDGTIPTTAATADIIITGEATDNNFGSSIAAADWNADGLIDLAVGAEIYSSEDGRAYIFYGGSIMTENASGADIKITGETNSVFNIVLAGDWNADGRTDLAVGAYAYSSYTGRVYIFYGGSIITEVATGADVIITGQATNSSFGGNLVAGDWNADGKTDLAVGASNYNPGGAISTGRAYLFYNDGSIPTTAATADVIITGEAANSSFGYALTSGDWNADGRVDLAVSASYYDTGSSNVGRAYIFYNGSIITENASGADVIITGETTSNFFGNSLASGDFNADGRTDLAVGAYVYSSNKGKVYIYTFNDPVITGETTTDYFGWSLASGDLNADGRIDLVVGAWRAASGTGNGRVYVFYNDSTVPASAASADAIITGQSADDQFSFSLATGDFNADGKTDLAVGAKTYTGGGSTGRAYIFYNGSIVTENASAADVIISGVASSNFGSALAAGDWNADGRTDLAVGGGFSAGAVYLFYNDGSIPTTAATADVTITGEASSAFGGVSMIAGDFNADGRTDLAVGASDYSSSTGRAYIFYNDGSIPTTAATADIILTGETTNNYFGYSLASGDFNTDGRTDLAAGAYRYSSFAGRMYLFYNDGSYPLTATTADVIISSEGASTNFGISLAAGDWNADGRTDLTVGANGYSSNAGRTYIFYNDGSISMTAATADMIITGETSAQFGYSLASGDYNSDGKTDLAISARSYSSSTGRVYLYTSEVAAPDALQDVSARTRGTIKTRGILKIR